MRLISPVTTLLALLLAGTAMAGSLVLVQQLRIDHAALVAAERDFRLQRDRGTLKGAEAADYAAYIARLHRRVAEDCATLARSGYPVPADLPCPDNRVPLARSASIDQAGEQTGSEQVAALDAELNSGLGEFDELLLREQQRVKAATPRTQDSGGGGAQGDGEGAAGGAGGYAGGATGEGDDAGEGDRQRPGTGGGRQGSDGAGGGPGRPGGQRAPGGQPPDIPDGSDDDVVARQLREAAEKETDPELKKKLWEEYRKYKQGTR